MSASSSPLYQVGLTGNVASGKSTVAELWAGEGVAVVSADTLARQVVAPGEPGLRQVVDLFGPHALAADGSFDRDAMRAIVFADPTARTRLETVLHPLIQARRLRWVAEQRRCGTSLVVAEVPLLFELAMEGEFDCTVLVDAPAALRLQRMVARRGLQRDEAERIMASQMDPTLKRQRADHVIDNSGSLDVLRRNALALLARLRAA